MKRLVFMFPYDVTKEIIFHFFIFITGVQEPEFILSYFFPN